MPHHPITKPQIYLQLRVLPIKATLCYPINLRQPLLFVTKQIARHQTIVQSHPHLQHHPLPINRLARHRQLHLRPIMTLALVLQTSSHFYQAILNLFQALLLQHQIQTCHKLHGWMTFKKSLSLQMSFNPTLILWHSKTTVQKELIFLFIPLPYISHIDFIVQNI